MRKRTISNSCELQGISRKLEYSAVRELQRQLKLMLVRDAVMGRDLICGQDAR